jgi:hypothetical protein
VLVGFSRIFLALCNFIIALIDLFLLCFPKKKKENTDTPPPIPSAPTLASDKQPQKNTNSCDSQAQSKTSFINTSTSTQAYPSSQTLVSDQQHLKNYAPFVTQPQSTHFCLNSSVPIFSSNQQQNQIISLTTVEPPQSNTYCSSSSTQNDFSTNTAVSKTTQETPNQTFLYPNLIYVSTDEVETQYSSYISS